MAEAVDSPMTISQRLARLVADAESDTVTLAWVLDQLHARAFGLFLLILALPCCIPFLYGVPQVVALPLLFIAGQMVLGWGKTLVAAKAWGTAGGDREPCGAGPARGPLAQAGRSGEPPQTCGADTQAA